MKNVKRTLKLRVAKSADESIIGLEFEVETPCTFEQLNDPTLLKEYNDSNGCFNLLGTDDFKTDLKFRQKKYICRETRERTITFEQI